MAESSIENKSSDDHHRHNNGDRKRRDKNSPSSSHKKLRPSEHRHDHSYSSFSRRHKNPDDDDDDTNLRYRERKRSHSRKDSSSCKWSRNDDSDNDSSSVSDNSTEDRKRSRKHHHRNNSCSDKKDRSRRKDERKERGKKRKHKKKDRKKSRASCHDHDGDRITPSSPPDNNTGSLSSRSFLSALHELLSTFPDMASQLVWMLQKMSGAGTSFNLKQMTNLRAAAALQKVFVTLGPFGVVTEENSGGWCWKPPKGATSTGEKRWDGGLLIRVMRSLLNEAGVTLQAVENYEHEESVKDVQNSDTPSSSSTAAVKITLPITTNNEDEGVPTITSELINFTSSLLFKFDSDNNDNKQNTDNPTTSLVQELASLCQALLEGETLSLDGIPNVELRLGLQILFTKSGLDYFEMEDGDEGMDTNTAEEKSSSADTLAIEKEKEALMGFGLPEDEEEKSGEHKALQMAKDNLTLVIQTCRHASTQVAKTNLRKKYVKGPFLPCDSNNDITMSSTMTVVESSDDSDGNDGPAPAGTAMAHRRAQIGPRIPSRVVKAMAAQRDGDLASAVGSAENRVVLAVVDPSAREEWMMKPGEHDFLQGIVRSGKAMQNRKFKNERGPRDDGAPVVLSARLQKQMADILKAHQDARGPSLIEQHRQKLSEEKAAKLSAGNNNWTWNRDADLDSGRRVDKNHLGQILGGAAQGLTDKFQGGLSRGFM